jgi:antitoxin component YwqK of YwqJK toxin-antitoxin module
MKRLSLIFVLVSLLLNVAKAQEIKEIDGIYYQNGQLYTGEYTSRYDNGMVKMTAKISEGKKEGIVQIFFENGQLNEIRSYKNNQMDGTWEMYNIYKVKVSVANYKNGLKHGQWLIFDDKGTLLYDMEYKDGQKTGTWKKYDETGKLISERKYVEGQ